MSGEQGRGVRRERGEVGAGGAEGRASSSECERAAKRQAGDVLGGLRLQGQAWRLRGGRGGGGGGHRLKACEALLEQALECSELADVRFVFDDGVSDVGGHRGLLSSVSEVFAGMFRAGMEESETGKVRVRGVSRGSFRVFLEYVYVGRVGAGAGMADGRELWVLAEAFQVCGLREWLLKEGMWGIESFCSAMEYAKSAEVVFEDLVGACEGRASEEVMGATEDGLREMDVEMASALLALHCGNKRLWRGCDVVVGFKFAELWVQANGGLERVGAGDVERLVGLLAMSKLPLHVITGVVRPSGLVSDARLAELEAGINEQQEKDLLPGGLAFEQTRSFEADGVPGACPQPAVYEGGADQLLAIPDYEGKCVRIYKVEGGEEVLKIGPDVEGLGELGEPTGAAFNHRGELLLSDIRRHCIHVFDGEGGYLRSIGREGHGDGELDCPEDLAVTPQGQIIVREDGNKRIQILKEDGTFVRKLMRPINAGGYPFFDPQGIAVGPDGSILVVDLGVDERVDVFDSEGVFVRTIGSRGSGVGQFLSPTGVCVLPGGQILVSDWEAQNIQVFSWEGEYLRTIKKEGDSNVELAEPNGLAVDSKGRVFVANGNSTRVVMLSRVDT